MIRSPTDLQKVVLEQRKKNVVIHGDWNYIKDLKENSLLLEDAMQKITYFGFNSYGTEVTDQAFKDFIHSLSKMKNVDSISLNLSNWHEISDEQVCALITGLSEIRELFVLELNLENCKKITDASLIKLCHEILKKHAYTLRVIDLNFHKCDLKNESLVALSERLYSMTHNLNSFGFSGGTMMDNTLMKFVNAFAHLNDLKRLKLKVGWGEITVPTLNRFASSMQRVSSLTHLELNFEHAIWSTDTLALVTSLLFGIVPFTKDFVCLSLQLSWIDDNDESQYKFSSAISRMKNLISVYLKCTDEETVTDSALITLGKYLRSLPALNNVNLDFSRCPNIGNYGVDNLVRVLIDTEELNTINLKIEGCENVSKEIVEKMNELEHLAKTLEISV